MARPETLGAVLFDFDGTLCDTERHNLALVREVLVELGAPVSDEELSADYIVLGVGLTKQLTLTYDGEEIAASEAVWTASGSAATAEGGLVTGVSEGECTVTAEYGGETAEASVIVTVIQRLTVSESEVVIALDGTAKLEASVAVELVHELLLVFRLRELVELIVAETDSLGVLDVASVIHFVDVRPHNSP